LNILNISGLNIDNDVEMAAVSEESLFQAGVEACHPDADALFISCTSLRVANVIQRLDQALAIPVVVSNQILAWHSLEIIGQTYQVYGFDTLFNMRLPEQ
jgi:maleate isomerase